VVGTTSVNRLAAACPHSAEHDEASDPDIHYEALDDLGKDHDPSDDIKKELDTYPQLKDSLNISSGCNALSSARDKDRGASRKRGGLIEN
jgi:hypothetical protein